MMRLAAAAYLVWVAFGEDECTCTSFQAGLERGGSACQFGADNCALRRPGVATCPGKGVPCCLNKSVKCGCPSYQEGAKHGDLMCAFQNGQNCGPMPEGKTRCPGNGQKCFLSLDEEEASYCTNGEEMSGQQARADTMKIDNIDSMMFTLIMVVAAATISMFLIYQLLSSKRASSETQEMAEPLMA